MTGVSYLYLCRLSNAEHGIVQTADSNFNSSMKFRTSFYVSILHFVCGSCVQPVSDQQWVGLA